ncbi:MAG: ComF family protein, partial [Elusimicrobia bacterium]|nr:ComF family protein [Elusimicrobiota bacterium]
SIVSWTRALLDLLFPRTCAACRDILRVAGPACPACLAGLARIAPPYCPRCGAKASGPSCLRCPALPEDTPLTRAAFSYRGPLPPLLHAFKYRGRLDSGRLLATWMARSWRRYPELGTPDALVPVPLHPRREAERGFNQAALLAEAVGREAGARVLPLLSRRRNTPPQARQVRAEREGRLAGAFCAAPQAAGLRVLLIDDAMTSGETLAACAAALRGAGAAQVQAFVLTRA